MRRLELLELRRLLELEQRDSAGAGYEHHEQLGARIQLGAGRVRDTAKRRRGRRRG